MQSPDTRTGEMDTDDSGCTTVKELYEYGSSMRLLSAARSFCFVSCSLCLRLLPPTCCSAAVLLLVPFSFYLSFPFLGALLLLRSLILSTFCGVWWNACMWSRPEPTHGRPHAFCLSHCQAKACQSAQGTTKREQVEGTGGAPKVHPRERIWVDSALLRNGGKSVFEMIGQARVFPAINPNGAKMALGRPTGGN